MSKIYFWIIRATGKKENCQALFHIMPFYSKKEIVIEFETNENFELVFRVDNQYPIDDLTESFECLEPLTDVDIEEILKVKDLTKMNYGKYSLKDNSLLFDLNIMCSMFLYENHNKIDNHFYHYSKGKEVLADAIKSEN